MTAGRRYLEALMTSERSGLKLGLSRFRRVLRDLDHPERRFRTLIVGGTNGKGSVAAMLACMMRAAGYRTGLLTSPHLLGYRERIRVDGRAISRAQVDRDMDYLLPYVQRHGASFFETMTGLAFVHFAAEGVQAAVLEVGLGGRLDATNVTRPLVATVVSVGMDHTRILGSTVASIAREKVAIARSGRPLVVGARGVAGVELERLGRARGARVERLGQDAHFRLTQAEPRRLRVELDRQGRRYGAWLSMAGRHQGRNAATAMLAAAAAHDSGLPQPEIGRGLDQVVWPGRLQWIDSTPPVLLDSAHNAAGSRVLADYLAEFLADRRILCVLGLLARKRLRSFLAPLLPHIAEWIVTEPAGDRAHPRADIARALPAEARQTDTPSVATALELAQCHAGPRDVVLVAGSLRVVAEALRALGRRRFELI